MHSSRLTLLAVSIALYGGVGPAAGSGGGVESSAVQVSPGGVSVSVPTAATGATLALRGPGGIKLQYDIAPGQDFTAPLRDASGAELPDGMYRFRLRLNGSTTGFRPEFGVFFVENGRAKSRQDARDSLRRQRTTLLDSVAPRSESMAASDVVPTQDGAVESNFITIYDNTGDQQVGLYLAGLQRLPQFQFSDERDRGVPQCGTGNAQGLHGAQRL